MLPPIRDQVISINALLIDWLICVRVIFFPPAVSIKWNNVNLRCICVNKQSGVGGGDDPLHDSEEKSVFFVYLNNRVSEKMVSDLRNEESKKGSWLSGHIGSHFKAQTVRHSLVGVGGEVGIFMFPLP